MLAVALRKNRLREKKICRIRGYRPIADLRPPRRRGGADFGRRVADAEHALLGGTFGRATGVGIVTLRTSGESVLEAAGLAVAGPTTKVSGVR